MDSVQELIEKYGFVVEDVDEQSHQALVLLLLLWHFRGGEMYLVVYNDNQEAPICRVPLLTDDKQLPCTDGLRYSLRFEANDNLGEAIKAVEGLKAYNTLLGECQ